MKKFLTITLFFISTFLFSQDIQYSQVAVKVYGQQAATFSFSYDWRDTCSNNYTVINFLKDSINFRYNIIIEKKVVAIGEIKMAATETMYFDDAFMHCDQIKKKIIIKIIENR